MAINKLNPNTHSPCLDNHTCLS